MTNFNLFHNNSDMYDLYIDGDDDYDYDDRDCDIKSDDDNVEVDDDHNVKHEVFDENYDDHVMIMLIL